MAHGLFFDLVLVYTIALGVMIAAGRAGIPAVIALIGAGVVTGPFGLQIVSTPDDVEQLAEIGIVLLLFTVGLDFPLEKLWQIWRSVLLGGALQIAGTAAIVTALSLAVGIDPRAALFVGLFVALSSTAIVLKELSRHNRLDSLAGRTATGILLFQDLCVVLLLLAAPILAGRVEPSSIPGVVARAALTLLAIAAIARFALPLLFRLVVASGMREAFPLAVLVGSVGTAAVGASLGLSMALGAFLAGLVLNGSEFSHQAHAEVRPLRDVLTSLFFISLGMLIDVSAFARNLPLILAVTLAAIIVKTGVAGLALAANRTPLPVALVTSLYLAQVGEFSFVLGRDALGLGVLSVDVWQLILPSSILTMLAAPAVVSAAPALAARFARSRAPDEGAVTASPDERLVIILGFGVGGRLVATALRDFHIPYRVIDLSGATVREARAAGEPIVYGDATAPDTLAAAGLRKARAVVVVLSDPDAALKVVGAVRRLAPSVPVLVRARYRVEAARLEAAGAIAVAEELEASLEVLAQLLARLDVPGNVVEVLLEDYRRREAVPARHRTATRVPIGELTPDLLATPIATHQVQEGDWATNRSLAEIDLRAATGVSVFAVRRDRRYDTSPPADLRLTAGDVLYLLGNEADVLLARHRLTEGH